MIFLSFDEAAEKRGATNANGRRRSINGTIQKKKHIAFSLFLVYL
jgi:hypothetical protein